MVTTGKMATHGNDNFLAQVSQKLLILLALICLIGVINVALTEPVARPRGVSLTNEPFYRDPNWFTCLDGSRRLFKRQVNDDYCDCLDSSDEPGTSACPQGKFHCNNKGFRPHYIPSSRINDGICDCCDASDEYKGEGASKCENNCRELGREDMERRQKEIILMNQGFDIRQDYIKHGASKKIERQESLRKLKLEKEEADKIKDEKERLKEEAEAPEKEAKDVHKSAWDAQLAILKEEREKRKASDAFDELDIDANGLITPVELANYKEFDSDDDGTVSEDEAKVLLGSVDEVNKDTFIGPVWTVMKDKFKSKRNMPTPEEPAPVPPPPEESGVTEQTPKVEVTDTANSNQMDTGDVADEDFMDEDDDLEDDDDEEFDEDMDGPELAEKYRKHRAEQREKSEDGDVMPDYDEATKTLIEVADNARKEFNEAEQKANELKRSIEELERLLNVDLGTRDEFQPLQSQCYEFTDREYTYKFCPFDKTTQRPKSGGSETQLGNWGNWDGPPDNKYSKMKYSHGRSCWNGPDRSSMVNLRCGIENKLVSAAEPERCTYEFQFETPSLCTTKTDLATGETDNHDEL